MRFLILVPPIVLGLLYGGAILSGLYEAVTCESHSFWKTPQGLECCTKAHCAEHG